MRVNAGLIGVVVLLCGAAPPPSVPSDTPAKERKICRQVSSVGSLIDKRTCHTRAEWEKLDAEGHRDAERQFQEQQAVNGGNPH